MKILILRNRNVLNTKWLVSFVNLLAQKDYEITLACDSYSKVGAGLSLDEKIKFVNLSAKTKNPFVNFFIKIREKIVPPCFRFAKLIKKEKPDLIIAYFPVDLANATYCQKHNIPIILMVHNYPPALFRKYLGRKRMLKKAFSKVNVYQVLLPSYKKVVPSVLNAKEIVDIPNIVFAAEDKYLKDYSVETKKIIYVARVEENVKRQHLLVEAFGRVAKDFPGWSVEFWGTSKYPDYDKKIMDTAKKYNVEDRVFLSGYHENISEVYKNADIHAFPSLYEGFSLALTDGMAAGLPSLGFDDAHSVNEIIINDYNGFLVSNLDEFSAKLKELMASKDLRETMGKNAIKSVENYGPDVIVGAWDKLIKQTIKKAS